MLRPNRKVYPKIQIADGNGETVNFQLTNGLNGAINPTTIVGDFYYNNKLSELEGFYIIPLVAGDLNVQLLDQAEGETFLIPSIVLENHLGVELPWKFRKIYKSLSTSTSVLIVW